MTSPKKSSGIVPVRLIDEEWEFLLLRAYRNWDFPKGEIQGKEDPWKAALRELIEETSISRVKERWGRAFIETEPYSRGKIARYYISEVPEDAEVKISTEHHEWRWLAYEEARSKLVPRLQEVIDWARSQILAS